VRGRGSGLVGGGGWVSGGWGGLWKKEAGGRGGCGRGEGGVMVDAIGKGEEGYSTRGRGERRKSIKSRGGYIRRRRGGNRRGCGGREEVIEWGLYLP